MFCGFIYFAMIIDAVVSVNTLYKRYVTQKEPAFEFEAGEATARDWIVWVENTPVKCGKFSLPWKKALLWDTEIEVVLVDVTESPVERSKKTKKVVLRQKEAPHQKTQLIVNKKSGEIIRAANSSGYCHDFIGLISGRVFQKYGNARISRQHGRGKIRA
jgi:hypothetical protein